MLMEKATEIVLCCELSEQGLSKSAIARRLGRDRETIRFWLRGVEQVGLKSFAEVFYRPECLGVQSTAPCAPGRCIGQAVDLADSRARTRMLWPEDRLLFGVGPRRQAERAQDLRSAGREICYSCQMEEEQSAR